MVRGNVASWCASFATSAKLRWCGQHCEASGSPPLPLRWQLYLDKKTKFGPERKLFGKGSSVLSVLISQSVELDRFRVAKEWSADAARCGVGSHSLRIRRVGPKTTKAYHFQELYSLQQNAELASRIASKSDLGVGWCKAIPFRSPGNTWRWLVKIYLPSVLKSCLELTSFPFCPSLPKFAWWNSNRVTPWPSERLAADTLRSLWSQVPRKSLGGFRSPKHRRMADHSDFTNCTAKSFLNEQTATNCYAFPQLPWALCQEWLSELIMKSFVAAPTFLRRVLEIGQCCPELNCTQWHDWDRNELMLVTFADWSDFAGRYRQMFFWDVHPAFPCITLNLRIEKWWRVIWVSVSRSSSRFMLYLKKECCGFAIPSCRGTFVSQLTLLGALRTWGDL